MHCCLTGTVQDKRDFSVKAVTTLKRAHTRGSCDLCLASTQSEVLYPSGVRRQCFPAIIKMCTSCCSEQGDMAEMTP